MEKNAIGNISRLCGSVDGKASLSHISRSKNFYVFPLRVARLSGVEDLINVVCDESKLSSLEPDAHGMLRVTGELRSYNNKSGAGNKLIIFVYAKSLEFCDGEAENSISLQGTVCKRPSLRLTPLGRKICDLLIAVNRPFGRSDYLPCIAWGEYARAASFFAVGDMVMLKGRIQSRSYIKNIDGIQARKTAFEVSASSVERITGELKRAEVRNLMSQNNRQ
jgi:single-stranded DNA-binding protein